MRRLFCLILPAVLSVALLAGCGSEQTATRLATKPTGSSTPTAAPASPTLLATQNTPDGPIKPLRVEEIKTPASRTFRGQDLYVLHGFLADARSTATLATEMAKWHVYQRVFNVQYPDDQSVSASGRLLADLVKTTTGTRGADLIAHSMGGLIARWAVEREGLSPTARNVVLLGTPNTGATDALLGALCLTLLDWRATDWWSRLISASLNLPDRTAAMRDMTPGSDCLRLLNEPSATGTDYFTLAGSVIPLKPLLANVATDLVVTVANANWSGLKQEGLKGQSWTLPANHFQLLSDAKVLRQIKVILWQEMAPPTV